MAILSTKITSKEWESALNAPKNANNTCFMTNFTSKLHPTTETKQEDITIFAQKSAEIFMQMLILAAYVDMIQAYRSMQVKNIALQIL